jgi:WD40 repeat protein
MQRASTDVGDDSTGSSGPAGAAVLGQSQDSPSTHDPAVVLQQGHLGQVSRVAFGDSGRLLVSAAFDATIRVWEAETGKLINIIRVVDRVLNPPLIAISLDGKLMAAQIVKEEVGIWDLRSGLKVGSCKYPYARSLAFSHDSDMLLVAATTRITVCNWKHAGSDKQVDLDRTLSSSAVNREGTQLVTADDESPQLWDTKTGEEVKELEGHQEAVYSVAFSPTQNLLASGSKDKTVRLWNLDTGNSSVLTTDVDSVNEVAFSRDGSRLLTKNVKGDVTIWDVKTGTSIGTMSTTSFGPACFSPDGKFVGIVEGHSLKVLDLDAKQEKAFPISQFPSSSIAFSPDSPIVAVGDGSDPTIWDLKSGTLKSRFGRHTDRLMSLGVSSDGSELISADSVQLAIWNIDTGGKRIFSSDSKIPGRSLLVLSPDHKVLAVHADRSLDERTTTLWDTQGVKKLTVFSDTAGAPIVFSTRGNYFAHVNPTGIVTVRDLEGKAIVELAQASGLSSLAFSPDDKLVAALTKKNEIGLWNLSDSKPPKIVASMVSGSALYFTSPDVLVATKGSKTVGAWNVTTLKRAVAQQVPQDQLRHWIASLLSPNQVNIFDMDSRQVIRGADLPPTEQISAADWNSRREILATLSQSGEMAIWKLTADVARKVCSLYIYTDSTWIVLGANGLPEPDRRCHL